MDKFVQMFLRETKYKNESDKIRLTLRLILAMSTLICAAEFVTSALLLGGEGHIVISVFLAVYLFLFLLSYRVKSKIIMVATNIIWLPWIIAQIWLFGWSTSPQLIVVLMSILSICCYYIRIRWKALINFLLLVYLVAIYIVFSQKVPCIDMKGVSPVIIYSIICAFTLSCILCVVYVFVKEEQTEDKKLVKYNIQLENQARTDALTGLYNRRFIVDMLDRIHKENDPLGFCVAMCDVDFFKKVNDNYGHDVGDEVLKKVASILKETIVGENQVGRWGGEEFLIVFPKTNGDQAMDILYNVQQRIKALEFNVLDRSFKITVTMGLAEYDFKSDAANIIKAADEKMYYGKENGRDQIVF